jgi:hypothetical protein
MGGARRRGRRHRQDGRREDGAPARVHRRDGARRQRGAATDAARRRIGARRNARRDGVVADLGPVVHVQLVNPGERGRTAAT